MKLRFLHLKDVLKYHLYYPELSSSLSHTLALHLTFSNSLNRKHTKSLQINGDNLVQYQTPSSRIYQCQCSKTLLLKTPCEQALSVGNGEIKLGLNWKVSSCWLFGFIVPGGTMQVDGGELPPTFLLGYGPCVVKYCHTSQDVSTCATVAQPSLLRPSTF